MVVLCRLSSVQQVRHKVEHSLHMDSTGTEARGYYGISTLILQGVKFVHKRETKRNIRQGQNIKDNANAIITHCHMSDIGP